MTITGSVPISGHQQGGRALFLDGAADVDQLIVLLAEPDTHTATLETDNAALDAHIEKGFGYLLYSGDELFGYSMGDSDSPGVDSEVGFPAGSGLPMGRFRAALIEFITTGGGLPTSIQWRDAAELPL